MSTTWRNRITAPRRFGWRVWFLPMFLWPLMLDLPIELVRGHPLHLVGACLGLGLSWLAASRLARGTAGDNARGARLMGVAAGLTAGLAAGMPPLVAVALGFGAFLGTRLVTQDLPEEAPPVVVPAPVRDALSEPQSQLARIAALAPTLPHAAQLQGAAMAIQRVVDDLALQPALLPQARRFLAIQLDGLARIVDRLDSGAAPPATLSALLTDLTTAAERLRGELRAPESEALDIQVKVLAERLRQEGP